MRRLSPYFQIHTVAILSLMLSLAETLTAAPVIAWGSNAITNVPGGVSNVVSVAAGHAHALALKRDGTVVAWGNNMSDQTHVPNNLSDVVAIAAGYDYSLALKADGTVVGWGNPWMAGQIPADLSNVVAIAAGAFHSLALKADGTLVTWGQNFYQQLDMPKLSNVVAIAAGYAHSLGLGADGKVFAWGHNWYGETSGPTNVNNVVAIAAGNNRSLALKADGRVIGWGLAGDAIGLSNVVAIAAGYSHCLALKADGSMVAWGTSTSEGNVPAGLPSVGAIAAGSGFNLAVPAEGAPWLGNPLVDRMGVQGAGVLLQAAATGLQPLSYQWRLDGAAIARATNLLFRAETPGLYSVLVSNAVGVVTSSQTAVGFAPLYINPQPQGQVVQEGTTVQLTVGVQSALPVAYQWQFRGTTLTNGARIFGAQNEILTISPVHPSEAGEYRVRISNALGIATSQVALLEVTNFPPIIRQEPEDVSVDAGQNAVFGFFVESLTTMTYQWFHRDLLGNTAAIPEANFYMLALPQVMPGDSGYYWCVASNSAGAATSAVAQLTVTLRAPFIISQPTSQTVDAGEDVSFYVSVGGGPPPAFQWQLNGQDIPRANSATLNLYSVSSNDVGAYRLVASNTLGVVTSADATLNVIYRPPFIVSSPYDQSVYGGNLATFTCSVAGGPKPALQWLFNGQPIAGAIHPSLSFTVTTTNQAGNYSVLASNVLGFATSTAARLTVTILKPSFVSQPQSQGVVAGESVVFYATVSGYVPTSLQWQCNGQDIPGASNETFYLDQSSTSDTGSYRAIASNEAGSVTSQVARLLVVPPGPLDRWQWRNPLPQGNDLMCAAYGNGIYVARGKEGATIRSVDGGVTWQNFDAGDLNAQVMAYGNGTFVAAGYKYLLYRVDGGLQCSPDGAHWTNGGFNLTNNTMRSLAFGNGRFVALTDYGQVVVSTNGQEWTTPIEPSTPLYSLCFGQGKFVAMGSMYAVGVSSNGLDWSYYNLQAASELGGYAESIQYGNDAFVVNFTYWDPDSYQNHWYTLVSEDAVSWTRHLQSTTNYSSRMFFGHGKFMAFSQSGENLGLYFTSTDGMQWNSQNLGASNKVYAACVGNGQMVIVGDKGAIQTSTNGQDWVVRSPGSPLNLRSMAWGGNRYVAVGNEGLLFTSADGVTWSRRQLPTANNLRAVAYGNSRFVVVGDTNNSGTSTALVSSNGLDWVSSEPFSVNGFYSIAYGKGLFVAAGYSGTIATSSDGFTWQPCDTGTSSRLNAITFNGDLFVAVGRNGTVLTSTNGTLWVGQFTPTTSFLQGVAYGNGRFVATGQGGVVLTSSNGIAWPNTNISVYALEDVQFANGLFMASGDGVLATSPDGGTWIKHRTGCQNAFRSTLYANGYVFAVGNNETLLQSDFFGPPILRVRSGAGGEGFQFTVEGETGRTYLLQASDDLLRWEDVFTFSNTRVTTLFLDDEAEFFAYRFYRVLSPMD